MWASSKQPPGVGEDRSVDPFSFLFTSPLCILTSSLIYPGDCLALGAVVGDITFLAECRPVRLMNGNGLAYRHCPTLVGYITDLSEIAYVLNIPDWPSEFCNTMSLCPRTCFDDPDYAAPQRSEAQAKQV